MIEYVKGDMFTSLPDNNNETVFLHACNCQGVWGAGVAKQFKVRYPDAFILHRDYCDRHASTDLLGNYDIVCDFNHRDTTIICLFTSIGYGGTVDTPEMILSATRLALYKLGYLAQIKSDTIINLPKINSGLFNVPWSQTEAILKEFPEFNFRVWEI